MKPIKCATVVKKGNITIIKRSERTSDVWTSTNYTEERQRIREFWLQLSEEERRSLVKVEKEAVLRKMKEQQKHSCNCSVCGKKRTAIEDELEVLYDAYYEELEQYAYRQQQQRKLLHHPYHQKSREISDEEDYDDDDEEEEEEDDDGVSVEGEHEDPTLTKNMQFESTPTFSNTLTVQGSVITVADDLLKNDGKKFLDMMEELAERKNRQEKEVEDNFLFSDEDEQNDHEEEESDEEEEEESDEESDEEEEHVEIHKGKPNQDSRTEEQRMEEGRRMFQVFAARMFEQRVLNAYREKVAQDRQKRLIEELEEEDRLKQERELKKQQDKQKKKDKRRQLKEQQEKERIELENKKRQEELAAKADREKKREENRLRKEQERQRKEEERLRKEEERKKKRLKAAERERKRKEELERKKKKEQQKESEREQQQQEPTIEPKEIIPVDDMPTTGPIGSPAKTEPFYVASEAEHHHSFFSSFLFGQPILKKVLRNEHTYPWTNGWTPLLALSDTVHTKLLGDVLTDKTSLILERTKAAYLRLNELARTKLHFIPRHHPLTEIHQAIQASDPLLVIDKQEIYQAILQSPQSGFQCYNLQHQGYVVQWTMPSTEDDYPYLNDIPPLLPISHTHPTFSPFLSSPPPPPPPSSSSIHLPL
ncbi:salt tolerance down-regulator-domain-containing protein [Blakeslea trispora]|nr:salt tolerance down-regulator-domain-containing protein [Blakeslea trispora]